MLTTMGTYEGVRETESGVNRNTFSRCRLLPGFQALNTGYLLGSVVASWLIPPILG